MRATMWIAASGILLASAPALAAPGQPLTHDTIHPAAAAAVAPGRVDATSADQGPQSRVVEISAQRFSFSPGEVRLKKGEPVTLRVRSADVTHGIFLRALGIDAELEPGKTTEVSFTPKTAGRFTAICHHFCGAGHGNMHMTFVVE